MLIVVNGAFKSGSTWLYSLIKSLTGESTALNDYQNPAWKHPSLDPDKINLFLESRLYKKDHYLIKQHLKTEELQNFLPYIDDDIVFIDIIRDIRDVIVSAFHHKKRQGYDEDFETYYWSKGRRLYARIQGHHDDMRNYIDYKNRYSVCYENLLHQFDQEMSGLAYFLKIDVDQEVLEKLKKESSFESMKNKNKDNSFFRKGVSGDYINYFNWIMLRDYQEQVRGKLPKIVPYYLYLKERWSALMN